MSSGPRHSNGRSHAPAEVDSTPVLTRLTASPACRQPARHNLDTLFGRGHTGKLFSLHIELEAIPGSAASVRCQVCAQL